MRPTLPASTFNDDKSVMPSASICMRSQTGSAWTRWYCTAIHAPPGQSRTPDGSGGKPCAAICLNVAAASAASSATVNRTHTMGSSRVATTPSVISSAAKLWRSGNFWSKRWCSGLVT